MRAIAIVDANASAVRDAGPGFAEDMARRFRDQGHDLDLVLVGTEDIGASIRRAAARPDIEALIVGGSDGSQSLAASLLAGTGKALGILPLGTDNLLARDLGIPPVLMEAVDALAHAHVEAVDLGHLNGRTFHSLSGLGFPCLEAHERQRTRQDNPFARYLAFALAFGRGLVSIDRMSLTIETDSDKLNRHGSVVLVTNNIHREPDWTRGRMYDGLLEVHIVRGWGWRPLARTGPDAMLGRWRQRGRIESIRARSVVVTCQRRRVAVSIDGQMARERSPLVFSVRRGVLRVLKPSSRTSTATAIRT